MKPVQTVLVTSHGTHLEVAHAVATASARALLDAGDPSTPSRHPWSAWLTSDYTKIVKRTSASKIETTHAEHGGVLTRDPLTGLTVCALPPLEDSPENRKRLPGQVSGVERPKPDLATEVPQGQWIVLNGDLGMSTGKASAQAAHVRTLAAREGLPGAEVDPKVLWASGSLFLALSRDPRTLIVSRDNGLTEIAPGSATGLLVEMAA